MTRLLVPLAFSLLLALPGQAAANDVEPRLFTNIPVGTNFLAFSYTRSEGNVAVDPSLALDVDAGLDTYVGSYSRAFGIGGKSATATVAVPYADLQLSGIVDDEPVSANRRAMADPLIRIAVNLAGAPALSPKEFASYRQKTIVGVNLEVSAPLGDYDSDRVLNFGANRWSIAPEIGVSHRAGPFTIEGAASFIWYSDNTAYQGDATLKQETIYIARANLLYHFKRPGTWLGVGTMYLSGGETTVDGAARNDLQVKSRSGVALALPLNQRHAFLLKYSTGVTTRIGADFDNYNVAYTYIF